MTLACFQQLGKRLALWSEDVIGTYFFENDDGATVTVNAERYGHLITDFVVLAIEEYDLKNMWFQ